MCATLLREAQCSETLNRFLVEQIDRIFALGHNGNLVNVAKLRRKLESKGAIFQTSTDSELIAHLILHKKGSFEERLLRVFEEMRGAWSLVFLTPDAILAARDPHGFRPLCIGKKGDAIIFASETCALDIIDAEYVRDVQPGEIVIADHNGLRSIQGYRKRILPCVSLSTFISPGLTPRSFPMVFTKFENNSGCMPLSKILWRVPISWFRCPHQEITQL